MFLNCKLFRQSFHFSNVASALVNATGGYVLVNPYYCALMGYTEGELLKNKASIVIPEEAKNIETEKINILRTQKLDNIQYNTVRKTKNGATLSVAINAIRIIDEASNEEYFVKQIDNITEFKTLQEEIKEKQFLLDTIINHMPVNIYFKDLQSRFMLVSMEQAKFFNVTSTSELIGKTDYDYFAVEHADQAFKDEQNIIKTGRGISKEEKEVWPDGTITWALTTKQPLKNHLGETVGTFGISRDITDLKTSERKLTEAHLQLERKNKALTVTLQNLRETQAQLVSTEKMAALGQLIAGVAHEINTPLGAINASNSNISHSLEQIYQILPQLYSNFTPQEVLFVTSLLKQADFSTIQLPSREKRAHKKEIIEKFQNAGIINSRNLADHILYMNLQNSIDELIPELLKIDAEKTLGAAKLLISLNKNSQNIGVATDKASNVVLALKKFIHRTADDSMSIADIKENIETVLILNQNRLKHGIELIKNYADNISKIECYPDELSQVWNNIITNAIQAMEGKGTLTIELKQKNNSHISVKISDTGCGIPEEIRENIFAPLFTTKVSGEGTGIGLDIVKRVVEKHKGTITLDSIVNEGTSFTIDLPLNPILS